MRKYDSIKTILIIIAIGLVGHFVLFPSVTGDDIDRNSSWIRK
jgi:hypothetical protein